MDAMPLDLKIPDLEDLTIQDIRHGLSTQHFTCTQLVKAYLTRIQEINSKLNCIIETNPDALNTAAERDSTLRNGHLQG